MSTSLGAGGGKAAHRNSGPSSTSAKLPFHHAKSLEAEILPFKIGPSVLLNQEPLECTHRTPISLEILAQELDSALEQESQYTALALPFNSKKVEVN